MDRSGRGHRSGRNIDSAKLRRTKSIAAVKSYGDDSSISSLGSFPEADLVAQQFAPGASKLSRQQTIAVDTPMFTGHHHPTHRDHGRLRKQPTFHHARGTAASSGSASGGGVSGGSAHVNTKQCPHCHKEFSNSWAVPKHVQRIHDRAGEFHCPRCLFKTSYHDKLLQHEKDAHRKCPHCRQLFVLLNKHVGTCPKRPR